MAGRFGPKPSILRRLARRSSPTQIYHSTLFDTFQNHTHSVLSPYCLIYIVPEDFVISIQIVMFNGIDENTIENELLSRRIVAQCGTNQPAHS
jgi:hypothetical protein